MSKGPALHDALHTKLTSTALSEPVACQRDYCLPASLLSRHSRIAPQFLGRKLHGGKSQFNQSLSPSASLTISIPALAPILVAPALIIAMAMINAGATRIGASAGIEIVRDAEGESD